MNHPKPTVSLCINAIILFVLFTLCGTNAIAQVAKDSKTESILKEIGQPYTRMKPDVFTIAYKGKFLKEISVVAAEGNGYFIGFVDVASKAEAALTPQMMQQLLEFNLRADFIKVGVGNDGKITVQTEQLLRLMDKQAVSEMLDQLATGADEVYRIIKPAKTPVANP